MNFTDTQRIQDLWESWCRRRGWEEGHEKRRRLARYVSRPAHYKPLRELSAPEVFAEFDRLELWWALEGGEE